MAAIEGVDYSRTPDAGWTGLASALKANGKRFVGRYAVTDKSPNGRGITAAEYQAMTAAGIEVFLYWEAQESWMLEGWQAGVNAARNAVANVAAAGMPQGMPVYYSHDIEPDPDHYAAVDDCLRGAASVVGFDRVGLYGGFGIIEHCAQAGTARWFCQTYAWSAARLSTAAHLYQYDNYGNSIAGVDVDLVRAMQANYGQASSFSGKPVYAKPHPPALKAGKAYPHTDKNGAVWLVLTPRRWTALKEAERKEYASEDAAKVGPNIPKGDVVSFIYSVHHEEGSWFVSKAGSRCRADAFVPAEG